MSGKNLQSEVKLCQVKFLKKYIYIGPFIKTKSKPWPVFFLSSKVLETIDTG